MPEPAPSNVQIFYYPTYSQVGWTNEDAYDHVVIWRKVGSADYASYDTIIYPTDYYNDYDIDYSSDRIYYKLKAYREPYVPSDFSDEVSLARYADTISETCDVSDSKNEGVSNTVSDTCSVSTSYNEGLSSFIIDTCNVTDSVSGSRSVKSLFVFYFGSDAGVAYTYSGDYKADYSDSILSSWRSKTTDFSELDPSLARRWKTVYRIRVLFRDLETTTPAIVSVSNDCGMTWAQYTKNIGTGTLASSSRDYWITPITGEFFEFKIEFPSTNKTFQFLGFEIEFEPFGERVDL